MNPNVSVSILLCTCNRAATLRQTLAALDQARVPQGWRVEVLVVDNASTDDTPAVVKQARLRNLELRYVSEPDKGKCHALNTGLAATRGEFILFTDDDVLPSADWIEAAVTPMLSGRCDAMTGRLLLAPDLVRPWFTPMHEMWLAISLDAQSRDWSRELI